MGREEDVRGSKGEKPFDEMRSWSTKGGEVQLIEVQKMRPPETHKGFLSNETYGHTFVVPFQGQKLFPLL